MLGRACGVRVCLQHVDRVALVRNHWVSINIEGTM
jgi:hypothetical protein